MIIENEFTRAERKQKEAEALAFENAYNNIIENKKLSRFEKQYEIRCLLGLNYRFEDEIMNELINEWRINDET
jgi:hypothetical protein